MFKTKLPQCIFFISTLISLFPGCKTENNSPGDPLDPDSYNPTLRSVSSQKDIEAYFKKAAKEYAERYINYWYDIKSTYSYAADATGENSDGARIRELYQGVPT